MMEYASTPQQAHGHRKSQNPFRRASTILLRTSQPHVQTVSLRPRKKYTGQEKLFIASLFLGAFGLGILTVTGLHLLVSG